MKNTLFTALFVGILSLTAVTADAATFTVTKSTNSDDGVCNADCSLREAVAAADSGDTVAFDSNLIGQTITLGGTEIVITKRITIDGFLNDPNVAFISGSNTSRIFRLAAGSGLTLKNAILVQGNGRSSLNAPGSEGGAIYSDDATLILQRVSIRGNTAQFSGAVSLIGGTHSFRDVSLTGNNAETNGALRIIGGATLNMSNTTISNNQSIDAGNNTFGGGAITVQGSTIVVRNSTIFNNSGRVGGGIAFAGGGASTLDIGNTIIAGNTATDSGQDIYRIANVTITSRGGNLIQNLETVPANTFTQQADLTGVNPKLGPTNAGQGGHPLTTHPLQAGSPAINGGITSIAVDPVTNQPLGNDARGAGFPRIAGLIVDKGAFEDQSNSGTLVVSKLTNSNDGVCDTDCSLREAVQAAGSDPGTDNITMAANVFGTMTLGGSDIDFLNNDVNIIGYPGLSADTLVISGSDTNRIFNISTGSDVSITGLTLANGRAIGGGTANRGGAILSVGANVTLDRVVVRNNLAGVSALDLQQGVHRILNTTINNNSAGVCSAIIMPNGSSLFMANTTISTNANTDPTDGQGTFCVGQGGATIRNSTIAFNRSIAGSGAGISTNFSPLSLGNTIIANNLAPTAPDLDAQIVSSVGGNLIMNTQGFPAGAFNQPSDFTGVDPQLANLANNGGAVPTHALQPGTPPVGTGLNAVAVDPFDNTVLMTDARGTGFARILGGNVDKGAFESLGTTAAKVDIAGRVMTPGGNGLRNAMVVLTDQQGNKRTATTTSFGEYKFTDVDSGETFIVTVKSKRYRFHARAVVVTETLADVDFTGQE